MTSKQDTFCWKEASIVNCEWLHQNLNRDDIRIFDCSSFLDYTDNHPTKPYNVISGFSEYNTTSATNANSASAAINKWLKPIVPEGCVIHSFRHSLRDRLRAVQCPSDMIDQIGGWSTAGVGQAYGEGYSVSGLNDFMLALYHEA